MPIISMFYGIIIRMYLLDSKHHNLPHIHAKYAKFEASVGIDDGEILAGKLPRKQLRRVTSGKGERTPGADGVVRKTARQKIDAVSRLSPRLPDRKHADPRALNNLQNCFTWFGREDLSSLPENRRPDTHKRSSLLNCRFKISGHAH